MRALWPSIRHRTPQQVGRRRPLDARGVRAAPLGAKLADETTDDTESFLPESAESTEVVRHPRRRVRRRRDDAGPDRLRARGRADRRGQAEDRRRRREDPDRAGRRDPADRADPKIPFQPGSPPGLVSEDGDVAYTVLTVPTDFDNQGDWGMAVRDIIEEEPVEGLDGPAHRRPRLRRRRRGGLRATRRQAAARDRDPGAGPARRDLPRGAGRAQPADRRLLRLHDRARPSSTCSPSRARPSPRTAPASWSCSCSGWGPTTACLLVSRYREELRRLEDKHEAMQHALRRSGPAILASGLTVTLAMLVLRARRHRQHQAARPGRRDRRLHARWSPG